MYTPDQAKNILKDILNVTAVTNVIAGVICFSGCRPPGSNEDLTIGVITLTDPSGENNTQRGVLNVNGYCKDKKEQAATQVYNVPNDERLSAMRAAVIQTLSGSNNQGVFWYTGNLWIGNISDNLKIEATKEHYFNIRVEIKLHN